MRTLIVVLSAVAIFAVLALPQLAQDSLRDRVETLEKAVELLESGARREAVEIVDLKTRVLKLESGGGAKKPAAAGGVPTWKGKCAGIYFDLRGKTSALGKFGVSGTAENLGSDKVEIYLNINAYDSSGAVLEAAIFRVSLDPGERLTIDEGFLTTLPTQAATIDVTKR